MRLEDLRQGRRWLADHGFEAQLCLRGEPDGLAAGALIARRALGEVTFADPFASQLNRSGPIVVIDRGVMPVRSRAAVLYIDRHDHPAEVRGTVVWDGAAAATSMIAWRLIEAPQQLTWLPALGILANQGDAGLAEAQPTAPVRELRALLELCLAADRLRDGPLTAAFTMLKDAATPQDALASASAAKLRSARDAVEGFAYEAARTPPQLGSAAALIDIDVPARVHPRLAAAWAKRLAPMPVVVTNRGWQARRVAYSIRCQERERLEPWLTELDQLAFGSSPDSGPRSLLDGDLSPEAGERFAEAVLEVRPKVRLAAAAKAR